MKFTTSGVGIVLLLIGIIMFMAFDPVFTSLSSRLAGYETDSVSKAEYVVLLRLNKTVIPITNMFIVIGVTVLLMGIFQSEKKQT